MTIEESSILQPVYNPSNKSEKEAGKMETVTAASISSSSKALKRNLSLTDVSNAHSKANPFKIRKSGGNVLGAGPARLRRSNSLNPFSLNKSFAKSSNTLSIDNPFTMLAREKQGANYTSRQAPTTTEEDNPIISKRKRACIEKENIPPDEMLLKTVDAQTSSSVQLSDSEEEEAKSDILDSFDTACPIPDTLKDSADDREGHQHGSVNNIIIKSADERSIKPKEILVDRDLIPIDWSLRKSVTISSTLSLDWVSSITSSNSSFSLLPRDDSDTLTSSRLCLWSAYTTPMPASHSAIISRLLSREMNEKSRPTIKNGVAKPIVRKDSEKAEFSFFKDREAQWKKSFQNAYRRVKNGDLSYLSYTNSSFTMIFTTVQDGKERSIIAKMSTSTPGFRMLLNEQEIEYEMVDGNGFHISELSAPDSELNSLDLDGFEGLIPKRFTVSIDFYIT